MMESTRPFDATGVPQCIHGRDVGDCDLDHADQVPGAPPASDGGVAATAVATTPPSTHALADALEKRLAAIRKVDRHVDPWVLGWFIGIAPDAVAAAIDAYERLCSPRADGAEPVAAGLPTPAATANVRNVL